MLNLLDRILDRLEEWIICVLIAAATCITFVAVVHRYGASNSVTLSTWAKAHGLVWLSLAADWVYLTLTAINLSWAQELATYMFVWMAKFGAALGVRTGIHVGVDVFVKQLSPAARKPVIMFRAAVRRAVHRHHRDARRHLCLRARSRPGYRRNSSGRAG